MDSPSHTIVDVLDGFFGTTSWPATGDVLSRKDLDLLADAVVEFYDAWGPPPSDSLRAYWGASIGMTQNAELPDLNYLFASLLWYPEVVIHEPFGAWFTRDRSALKLPQGPPGLKPEQLYGTMTEYVLSNDYFSAQQELGEVQEAITNFLKIVSMLRPLLVAGKVVGVPPWKLVHNRQMQIETAMRHDQKKKTTGFMIVWRAEALQE